MFENCENLTSFNSDLSSLEDGHHMFDECKALTTFSYKLKNAIYAYSMFYGCENLTSFNSDLSSLIVGLNMFFNCKLDAVSVQNIINTIKDVKEVNDGKIELNGTKNVTLKTITIGMGCSSTDEADRNLFAQEAGYADMDSLLEALDVKGWTVNTQYNGRPTTTYDLRRPSEGTLPVFVKLEEDDEHAYYMTEDGSKKYRLDWFHKTTGSTDGYTQYASLEEAIEALGIKPIEK